MSGFNLDRLFSNLGLNTNFNDFNLNKQPENADNTEINKPEIKPENTANIEIKTTIETATKQAIKTLKPISKMIVPDLSNQELEAIPVSIQKIIKYISIKNKNTDKVIGIIDVTNPAKARHIVNSDIIKQIFTYHYVYGKEFREFIHKVIKNSNVKSIFSEPLTFKFGTTPVYNSSNQPTHLQEDTRILISCYTFSGGLIYNQEFDRAIQVLPRADKTEKNRFEKSKWVEPTNDNRILPAYTDVISSNPIKIHLSDTCTVIGKVYVDKKGYIYLCYRNSELIQRYTHIKSINDTIDVCIAYFDRYKLIYDEHFSGYATFSVIPKHRMLNNPSVIAAIDKLQTKINQDNFFTEDLIKNLDARNKEIQRKMSANKTNPNKRDRLKIKQAKKQQALKQVVENNLSSMEDKKINDKINRMKQKQQVILDNPGKKPEK